MSAPRSPLPPESFASKLSQHDPHDAMLRCAYAALAATTCDVEACRVHAGWQIAPGSEPEVDQHRDHGASFDWVAVQHLPVRMFDLHAGIVETDHELRVGLHARPKLGARERLVSILSTEPVDYRYSEIVDEQQCNYAPQDMTTADWSELRSQLSHCIDLLPLLVEEARRAQH